MIIWLHAAVTRKPHTSVKMELKCHSTSQRTYQKYRENKTGHKRLLTKFIFLRRNRKIHYEQMSCLIGSFCIHKINFDATMMAKIFLGINKNSNFVQVQNQIRNFLLIVKYKHISLTMHATITGCNYMRTGELYSCLVTTLALPLEYRTYRFGNMMQHTFTKLL